MRSVNIFVSYSHQDASYIADDSLLGFLKGLQSDGIVFWDDRQILPGETWDDVIKANLQRANMALVLVSQSFLDSKYCANVEIQGFLAQQAHIFPVILSPCDWKRHGWLAQRQFLPPGDQTIEEHYKNSGKRKRLYLDIREKIRQIVDRIRLEAPEPDLEQGWQQYVHDTIRQWSKPRYALDTRFVELTLLLDQGEDAQGMRWQAASETCHDLEEVLAKTTEPALVILGPPGSGKSTLLRHYELQCARVAGDHPSDIQTSAAPITFFIQLNDFRPVKSQDPMPDPREWLEDRWAKKWPRLPSLETLFQDRPMTLLLDALNEMPYSGAEAISRWRDCIQDLAHEHPQTRMVFSCRSLDYSASLSSKEFPVPQVRIEALSDEQIQGFLEAYCPAYHETLWEHLRNSPQLALLRSPYYLKLLVEQTATGEIPSGRAALFTGFVRQALQREVLGDNPVFHPGGLLDNRDIRQLTQARAGTHPFALPERGPLVPKLSQLAFRMQDRQSATQHRQSATESGQVRVAYDEALAAIDDAAGENILKAGGALGVLEEDLERDEILFIHQLVQEYFAARQLAHEPNPKLVAQEWQQDRVTPSLAKTLAGLANADPLPPLPTSGWEETTVLASVMAKQPDQFVTDLVAVHLPLAARCAAQVEGAVSEAVKQTIRWALVERTQDPQADLRARIEAGLALGPLGDPRFEQGDGPEGAYRLPPFIPMAGGAYPIGSDDGQEEDEGPAHQVNIMPFEMAQFPVTNAEWALFMKAGGYEEERWWETQEAKAWRRGENTAEGPKEEWRNFRDRFIRHPDELEDLQRQGQITSESLRIWQDYIGMSLEEFEDVLSSLYPSGRQTGPAVWSDEAFNHPQQPVVGVCWHEARAYCAWLSAQDGDHQYRFPTEVEWEAAARGRVGRRYSYGNTFDSACSNTFETHVRRTTPVGVFPNGQTPEGLMDLTGNVWEWTSSLYITYPYQHEDGREALMTGTGRRVVRGGSSYDNRFFAGASYRNGYHPGDRSYFIGFRVVRSSPIS
ncbi:MAG: SUMF1/EgtB/PvdO family nonheme iron enzyme [Nitrospirales bacterium]|nr:SUMF1/EgtB/PvdO family nonheme iron enzyme [Nitrospirales bacterium]